MTIRIVLADDHAPFRGCLKELLERQQGLAVVREFDGGRSAVEAMRDQEAEPASDVLVLDMDMADLGGLDTARQIIDRQPDARILILSWHDDLPFVRAARKLGCRGYMLKDDPFPELVQAIRDIAAGQTHISNALSSSLGISASQSPQFAD